MSCSRVRSTHHRRGAAAVAMVVLMLMLSMIVLGMVLGGAQQQDLAVHELSSTRALYAAEAGVNMALQEVIDDEDHDDNGVGIVHATDALQNSLHNAGFSVSSDGAIVTGYGQHGEARQVVRASLETSSTGNGGTLRYGAGVNTDITMTGNVRIDAMDSSTGSYSPWSNANDYASVGTNGTGAGQISLTGSSTIHGDVFVGPESNPSSVISTRGRPFPGHTQTAMDDPYVLPQVSPPSNLPASQGNSSFASWGNETMNEGVYHFDRFDVGGSFTLNIDGDVVIYTSGEFNVGAGSTVNIQPGGSLTVYADSYAFTGNAAVNMPWSGSVDPTRARLFQTGDSDLRIVGSARVAGVILAPTAHVSLKGNARSFGAVVADSLTLTGSSRFTQDLALAGESVSPEGTGGGGGTVGITQWAQISPMQ